MKGFRININLVVLVIFGFVIYQMGEDLLHKEFMLRKLIALILVVIGFALVAWSEIRKIRRMK